MVVKMKKRIFISLILCISIILCNINSAKANVGTGIVSFFDLFHKLKSGEVSNLLDFIDQTFTNSGLLGPKIPGDLQSLEDFIHDEYPSLEGETSQETQENVSDYLTTNISVNDNSETYTFNDNSRDFFLSLADYYEDNNKISIWYTCDVQQSTPNWMNATFVADFVEIEDDYPDYIYTINRFDASDVYLIGVPKNPKIYGVLNYVFNDQWKAFDFYRCNDISGILSYEPISIRDSSLRVYTIDSSGNCHFISDNSQVNSGYGNYTLWTYFNIQSGQSVDGNGWQRYPKSISTTGDYIQTFSSVNALDTYIHSVGIGIQPYYYNNQTWSDFSSSTGDYTVDNSNVNTVTYGDVVSYVNDYHDTNNNYPDNSTVNNWIETTNNNNTGGGSGGSGGDSGGSGIVSILSALGKAIADLITGIVAFITEIIGGLVEAITGLLTTLTDLISNFTESIPNIFSPLLGWLFDGLPDEFTAIILLGLTACVIASIIKILRG